MYGVIHCKENEQLWGVKWFIFHEILKSNMKQHSQCILCLCETQNSKENSSGIGIDDEIDRMFGYAYY